MSEKVKCTNPKCGHDFDYEPEIIDGATKGVGDHGQTKGIFSKKQTKKMNTELQCPHCKKSDFYKVTVTV